MLDADKQVITDNGYAKKACLRDDICDDINKRLHALIRARHECINGKLKIFRILTMKFRHNIRLYRLCFHAIVHMIKLDLDCKPNFEIRALLV